MVSGRCYCTCLLWIKQNSPEFSTQKFYISGQVLVHLLTHVLTAHIQLWMHMAVKNETGNVQAAAKNCEFWGFHSTVIKDSSFLGRDATPVGKCVPTFLRNITTQMTRTWVQLILGSYAKSASPSQIPLHMFLQMKQHLESQTFKPDKCKCAWNPIQVYNEFKGSFQITVYSCKTWGYQSTFMVDSVL